MHTTRSDTHGRPGARSARTGASRARSRAGLTALLATLTALASLVLAGATPASAATVNGIATIANPVTLKPVTSGASTTPFTVALPAQAACSGDTASNGYHVYSYLVPQGTAVSGVTFHSYPSTGYGFVDNIGTYYGPVNTAIGTGQIVSIPNNFQWGPLVSSDGVTLLYAGTGSTASGIWEAGIACANSSGTVSDNWNTEVTFNASSGDANGFTWTAVPGPSGSAPAAFTSASTTTFTQNVAGSFSPVASGSPSPTITETGTLPTGITFTGGALTGSTATTGTFPITFTAHNGILADATQSFSLQVVANGPTVTGVSPVSGLATGGTSVTITGTNLSGATSVKFGSAAASISIDTATAITATAPAGTGTVDVTVTTPGGTSVTSSADQFTYLSAPSVTGVAPSAGPTSGGTSVTISGSNLSAATGVAFGSTPAAVSADTATSITATAPAGTGTVDVTVTTPSGTSVTSSADQFTYVAAPVVTGIAPSTGPTSGGTSVTISGSNLDSASVAFGSSPATVTADSTGSITATAPAGTGTVDITVSTAGGTSVTSSADQFVYVPAPVVTGIAPSTGATTGGTSVTITGTDLGGVSQVLFGSTPATVTSDTLTTITATSPSGSGAVDVTVITTVGTSATSSSDLFTYGLAPVVTGLAPAAGPATGGTSVVISGTNLSGVTAVAFGSTPATVTASSATSVTVTAPPGTGTVNVTVTTGDGASPTSSADQFTYVAAPVVTGIAPSAGPTSGGTSVTISGSNLSTATVAFGSTPATVTASSATSVTVTAPAGTGTVDVTATTVGGTSATSSADQFTYGTGPSFTSPATTTFVIGTAGTFSPAASGSPAPGIAESGTLPTGVSFVGGGLSGTPTTAGTYGITFTATNGIGSPVSQSFALIVVPLEITTTVLPVAHVGAAYTATLTATGGVQPYKWKVTAGALPKGLKLTATTGVISGTVKSSKHAPAPGPYVITVTLTDHSKHVKLTTSSVLTLTLAP